MSGKQKVYTLLVQLGRKVGDGLPEGATGAALMCYASGVDEAEAVRETVAILKQADTAPLDVTGYGTLEEREAAGHEIGAEERALMLRALEENAVILKQADTAPLDVTGYGTLEEREAAGHEIGAEERALMLRALEENAVIVAQMTPFFGDAEDAG